MSSRKLEGKVALVTGAGAGMGKAISFEFAKHGARVILVDIDSDRVERAKNELGGSDLAFACVADISDPRSIDAMYQRAFAATGHIDILVNNAGILDGYCAVTETGDALWDRIVGVNLKGTFLVSRAVLPQMVARGSGVVINIASIAGLVAGGGGAAYTASKHGVIGLTKQMALDYGKRGIRVNAICPGAVETEMTRDILNSGDLAVMEAVKSVPAGRHAQPEEIAKVALFLASDDSSFAYGGIFTIDGGWTVK